MHKYVNGGLVFFLILYASANNIKGLMNVSGCPSDSTKLNQRELLKLCDKDQGFIYHCMKSSWNTFVEFCMVPVSINVYDGCPQIQANDTLKLRYVKCSISGKCPNTSKDTYLSYLIYEYDGCYKEEIHETQAITERTSTPKHGSKCSTTIAPYTFADYNTSNDTVTEGIHSLNPSPHSTSLQFIFILVSALGIIVLLLLVSMTTLIYYLVKARKDTNGLYLQSTDCNVNRQEDSVYNEIETI